MLTVSGYDKHYEYVKKKENKVKIKRKEEMRQIAVHTIPPMIILILHLTRTTDSHRHGMGQDLLIQKQRLKILTMQRLQSSKYSLYYKCWGINS